MTRSLADVVQVAVLLFLGLLFIVHGGEKLFDRGRFERRLALGGIWSASSSRSLALLVPPAEYLLGALLLAQVAPRATLSAALAVLIAFTGYRVLVYSREADCGCEAKRRRPTTLIEAVAPSAIHGCLAAIGLVSASITGAVVNWDCRAVGVVLASVVSIAFARRQVLIRRVRRLSAA